MFYKHYQELTGVGINGKSSQWYKRTSVSPRSSVENECQLAFDSK